MPEKTALIIANIKNDQLYLPEELAKPDQVVPMENLDVTDLAEALYGADYKIVSEGKTADYIKDQTSVPIVQTDTFMRNVFDLEDLDDIEGLPNDSKREIMSVYVAQCLRLRRDRLESMDWPIIDFLYAGLTPPTITEDKRRDYEYLKMDSRVGFLADKAIEGRRLLLMDTEQIAGFIRQLQSGNVPTPESVENRQLSDAALAKMQLYKHLAKVNLGHLATMEMRLPDLNDS